MKAKPAKPRSRQAEMAESNGMDEEAMDMVVDDEIDTDGGPPSMEDQDPAQRRQIRRNYRDLMEDVAANKHELTNPESCKLNDKLEEADKLNKNVKKPREAVLDAQVLAMLSNLGRQKAQAFHTDFVAFQPFEFVDKMANFVRGGAQLQERDRHVNYFTGDEWRRLGEAVQPFFRKTPPFRYMLGSFERGEVVVTRKHRAQKPEKEVLGEKTVPKQLQHASEADKREETTEEVERILGSLQRLYKQCNKSPVCYFEFVVNPQSFGHTIENIFHTSFLVRDGLARIMLDGDRLPVIEPVEDPDEQAAGSDTPIRHQTIISLTQGQWREIVEVFGLKNQPSMIPPRQQVARGRQGGGDDHMDTAANNTSLTHKGKGQGKKSASKNSS